MTTCFMVRTVSGLAADDEAATNVLRKVKPGDVVKVDVVRPRNLTAHRKWWALCNLIYLNCEDYASPDVVHGHLKILAGHADPVVSKATGETWLVPRSISFSSLGEDEFQDVWRRAVQAVVEHIIPTITVPTLEDEVLRMIGGVIPKEVVA